MEHSKSREYDELKASKRFGAGSSDDLHRRDGR
jgi:hypothetical protein